MSVSPSSIRLSVHRRDFFGDLGDQSEESKRCQLLYEKVSGEPSHVLGLVFLILRTPRSEAGREFGIEASRSSRLLYLDVR
jgi:hypothetical protein